MALIHRAQLSPTKHELIAGWLPSRPWIGSGGSSGPVELIGAYRFDDPAGAVGIETHLVRVGDAQLLQVPLTYRAEPLGGADAFLVGTTQHSVLGRRWVYDGCGDAVYAAALAAVILTGGREAEQWVELADGRRERRESATHVVGTGTPGAEAPAPGSVSAVDGATSTTVTTPGLEIVVRRVLDGPVRLHEVDEDVDTLTGTWPGSTEPTVLAYARRRPI